MPRYPDKYRSLSWTRRLVGAIAISSLFGAIFGVPVVFVAPAQVAAESTWNPLADIPFRFDKPGATCVVLPGDTLTMIAHRYLVAGGWQEIYHRNITTISDPDVIHPGQRLNLR
ncbi:MAG: LysM peptidoglycan-binding domain-containing protein [Pseudonocardiaceae bacterium]